MWVLLIVYIFNFIDRSIFGILTEPMKLSLQLEDWHMGLLGGLAFAISQASVWTMWHTATVLALAALNILFLYLMPAPTPKGQKVRTEIEGFAAAEAAAHRTSRDLKLILDYDKDFQIVPSLATAWEQREPTVWRFTLREGVKFHDGSAFTADDAVFSLQRAMAKGLAQIDLPSGHCPFLSMPETLAETLDAMIRQIENPT